MSIAPATTPLSDAEFDVMTRAILAAVEARLDQWLQDDVIDIDSQRTGGLLELSLPGGSKIVINTQPPLHELWLAARSGGYHFRYLDGEWIDARESGEFFSTLSRAISAQAGKTLTIEAQAN